MTARGLLSEAVEVDAFLRRRFTEARAAAKNFLAPCFLLFEISLDFLSMTARGLLSEAVEVDAFLRRRFTEARVAANILLAPCCARVANHLGPKELNSTSKWIQMNAYDNHG